MPSEEGKRQVTGSELGRVKVKISERPKTIVNNVAVQTEIIECDYDDFESPEYCSEENLGSSETSCVNLSEGTSLKSEGRMRIPCEIVRRPYSAGIAVVHNENWLSFLLRLHMLIFLIKMYTIPVVDRVICLCRRILVSLWSSVKEVFVNQLSSCSCLAIQCQLGGQPLRLLIDTGSQVSIICTNWYRKWKKAPKLEEVSTRLRCVGGTRVAVDGTFTGELSFGDHLCSIPWLVANIESSSLGVDGILGIDALTGMRGILDLEKKELILPKRKVACQELPAQLVGATTLESGKSAKLKVTAPMNLGVFEPNQHLKEAYPGLLIARVVADGSDDIVVPVINTTDDKIELSPGINLGKWELVEVQDQEVLEDVQDTFPDHLVDLFDKSGADLTDLQRQRLKESLMKYQSVFAQSDEDLGRTNFVQHKVETGEARPVKQHPRRLPMMMREAEQQEVDRMLKQNIIVQSSSPWASPTVLVRKKDGKIRFCVDYRKLNELTKKDAYPLPRIDDCIDNLDGAQFFCTLDLQAGYWQVLMDPEDQEKTAFCTRSGLYEFRVMPFGLTNAVATFERLMEMVLRGLQWNECLVYLDDIIVFGTSFEQTLERLTHVFDRIQQAGLKLKPSKCTLFAEEVNFLGHVISRDGVHTQSSKIQAVKEWPVPRSVKEVRSFLGLAGYYRRFIKNYAKIARPLHKLTSPQVKFIWNEDCQHSFEALKEALTTAPVLGYPRQEGQMILDTDASGQAVGAVLSQIQDGREVVLAYMSKSLTPAETNYCVTRKEMLAVVTAVKTWRPYVLGRKVLLRTDNSAVAWAKRIKEPVGQMARWLQELGCLDLVEQHRPGRIHWNADALSRRTSAPCHQCHRDDGTCVKPNNSEVVCSAVTRSKDEEEGLKLELEWRMEELREDQATDDTIKPVLQAVEKGVRPPWSEISGESEETKSLFGMWDRLLLSNGLLYRKYFSDEGDTFHLQLVVPRKRIDRLLDMAHADPLGGHFGAERTLRKLHAFYWSGIRRDVKRYCTACELCMARKPKNKNHRAPMKIYLTCAPMERVTVDIMGPVDRSAAGNKFILVVTDTFTKFTEAYALRNIEAKTVAKKLVEEWICRYGTMSIIHSDQGRQFESRLFSEVCKLLGIHKTRTTPWRPKANGQVERFNRTLGALLCIYCQEETKYWDKHLPFITSAYRAAKHESTGHTPNMMVFGREARMPLSLLVGNAAERVSASPVTGEEYVNQLALVFQKAYHSARLHLRKNAEIRKRRYDIGTSETQFSVGQPVWLYDPTKVPGKSPKFRAPWKKGWKVKNKIDDIHYMIENSSTTRVVHVDRLCSKQE
jgi:transposase InsO family protein